MAFSRAKVSETKPKLEYNWMVAYNSSKIVVAVTIIQFW